MDSGFESRRRWLLEVGVFAALGALSALALWPLLSAPLWPSSHENARYAILLDHFREAFRQGQWYPRWLPNLNGGYGYPTFVYYQPAFFFFALPFSFLPGYPETTFPLVVWALFFLGGLGAYWLCREMADLRTALAGAALYLLTPYLYVELYVRNDLSELMAMTACPWPLFFALRLDRRVREGKSAAGSMVGFAVALAATIAAHPAVALFVTPVYALMAAYRGWTGPWKTRGAVAARLAASFAAAVLLSAPYWFTLFQMKRYVDLSGVSSGYYAPSPHVVYWWQFLSNAWEFGGSAPGSAPDTMSFQLGLPHAVLALAGLAAGWRSRAVRGAFFAWIAVVALVSTLAERFWEIPVESLRQVQFPWRLLAIAATLQVACAAGLQSVVRRHPLAAAALLIPALVWYRQQFFPQPGGYSLKAEVAAQRAQDLRSWQRYANTDEFRPLTAVRGRMQPRGAEPLVAATSGARAAASKESTASHLRWRIEAPAAGEAIINQIYLPGWRVYLDEKPVARETLESRLTADGRMRVGFSAGSHELEAYYGGPPGAGWRDFVLGLGLAAFLAFCAFDWRKARRAAASPAPAPGPASAPAPAASPGAGIVGAGEPEQVAHGHVVVGVHGDDDNENDDDRGRGRVAVRPWWLIAAFSGAAAVGLFAWLAHTPAGRGWHVRRFGNTEFRGAPVEDRVVSEPFAREEAGPAFSAEWEAWVAIEESGNYEFALQCDDQGELIIDGARLVWAPGIHGRSEYAGRRRLEAGIHSFRVRLADFGGGRYLRLFWNPLDGPHNWYPMPFPRAAAWPTENAARLAASGPRAPARTWLFGASLLLASLAVAGLVRARALRRGGPVLSKQDWIAAAAILVLALGMRAFHLHEVDVHSEEGAHLRAGQQYVRNVLLGDFAATSFVWNRENPPLAKWMYGLSELAGGPRGAKLFAGFLEALACLILFLLGRRFVSRAVGIGAGLALALSPYFIAHGRMTGLEAPSAFAFAIGAYLLATACLEKSPKHHFAWAFVAAMAMGIGPSGIWFAPVALAVLGMALWRERERKAPLTSALAGAAAGLVVLYLLWRGIWTDPIPQLRSAGALERLPSLSGFGERGLKAMALEGLLFLARSPLGLVAAALVWLAAAARRRSLMDGLIAAWILFPFGQSLSPVREDAARGAVQALPALALAAAWGVDTAAQALKRAWSRPLAHASMSAYLAACVWIIHPYELDYFSEWTGGAAAVARRRWLSTPACGEGLAEAARAVNQAAAPGARVSVQLLPRDESPGLRRDLVPSDVAQAEYLVVHSDLGAPGPWRLLHEVRVGGAVLARVFQRLQASPPLGEPRAGDALQEALHP